ncbi:MAG: hypothetical protein GC159_15945 [Phycisphaera sp.]|nr:hypothetical protein [Phycisphaera sp.]
MPKHSIIATGLLCWLVMLAAPIARADDGEAAAAADAKQRFDRQYAFKLQLLRGTPRRSDDAEYAAELFNNAQESGDDPAMQVLLARTTVDLTADYPPAQALMLSALQMLNRIDPASRPENYAKIVEIRREQFTNADEERMVVAGNQFIEALTALARIEHRNEKWDEAVEHYRTARQTAIGIKSDRVDEIVAQMERAKKKEHVEVNPEQLKEAIKANKDDQAAIARLMYAYVIELDQPEEARKYTFLIKDEPIKDHIRLAARRVESLNADEALTLARWYQRLTDQAPTSARPALRDRAELYLARYRAIAKADAPIVTESDARKISLKPAPVRGDATTTEQLLDALRPGGGTDEPTLAANASPSTRWLRACLDAMPGNTTVALHLTFDDNAGSDAIVDHSGYRNLVLNVATLYDTGSYGQARRLTGNDSYLATQPAAGIDPTLRPVGVGMWIKPDKDSGVLFAHGDATNGYALYLHEGKLYLAIRNNTSLFNLAGPDPLPNGWVHVGMALSEGKVSLMVNGKTVVTKSYNYLGARPAEGVEIGTDDHGQVGGYTSTGKRYAGLIYEVVWLVGQRLR